MDWELYFKDYILERGYRYFIDDQVSQIKTTDEGIMATVEGTVDYEVEIYLNDRHIKGMFCSCPFADLGNNCKHMAAVLYAYNYLKDQSEELTYVDNSEMSSLEDLVNQADDKTIRQFLLELLENDDRLKRIFTHKILKLT